MIEEIRWMVEFEANLTKHRGSASSIMTSTSAATTATSTGAILTNTTSTITRLGSLFASVVLSVLSWMSVCYVTGHRLIEWI